MATRTLYFDEAGHTGPNFMDPDQPIFTIVSTDIGDEEAKAILDTAFPGSKKKEHRWKGIWQSNDKIRLIDFGRALRGKSNRVLSWACRKDYLVITKIADYLIEPKWHTMGHDFYKGGYARRFANELYFSFLDVLGEIGFRRLLADYQQFSRNPSEQALIDLQAKLIGLRARCVGRSKHLLEMIISGADFLPQVTDIEGLKGSDDVYLTSMNASIVSWRQMYSEDFHVIYDKNAHFERQVDMWEAITGSEAPAHIHPLGDGTTVEYPLRVIKTTPMKSEDSPAIQLCDLVAGFSAKLYSPSLSQADAGFLKTVIYAGLGDVMPKGLMPTKDFPSGPPLKRTGPDPVDLMTDVIFSSEKMRQKHRPSEGNKGENNGD